jgi:hypothetical protein
MPSEPFGDFSVGEFGGIDGRQNILRVRTDGVALLISSAPAAGRWSDQKLGRLQALLTSEQFRKEVAAQRTPKTTEQVCSDLITNEVTMGNLSMSRTEPCGEEPRPAPTFEEIVSIVAPAMRDDFDGAVETTEPRLHPIRLERMQLENQAGYMIKLDAAGRGTITRTGGEPNSANCQSSSVTRSGCSWRGSSRSPLCPALRRSTTDSTSPQNPRSRVRTVGSGSVNRSSEH